MANWKKSDYMVSNCVWAFGLHVCVPHPCPAPAESPDGHEHHWTPGSLEEQPGLLTAEPSLLHCFVLILFRLHVCAPQVGLVLPVEVRRGVRFPRTGVVHSHEQPSAPPTHTQIYKENQAKDRDKNQETGWRAEGDRTLWEWARTQGWAATWARGSRSEGLCLSSLEMRSLAPSGTEGGNLRSTCRPRRQKGFVCYPDYIFLEYSFYQESFAYPTPQDNRQRMGRGSRFPLGGCWYTCRQQH